ncbi:MAG: hypothetical protein ACFFCQ_06360 [Promethearchaeota archaeon]
MKSIIYTQEQSFLYMRLFLLGQIVFSLIVILFSYIIVNMGWASSPEHFLVAVTSIIITITHISTDIYIGWLWEKKKIPLPKRRDWLINSFWIFGIIGLLALLIIRVLFPGWDFGTFFLLGLIPSIFLILDHFTVGFYICVFLLEVIFPPTGNEGDYAFFLVIVFIMILFVTSPILFALPLVSIIYFNIGVQIRRREELITCSTCLTRNASQSNFCFKCGNNLKKHQ